jgi:hypothetical protein
MLSESLEGGSLLPSKKTSTKKATTTTKSAESKPTVAAPAPKPELTDADVVSALIKIQKRKLTNSEFSAVTQTIALLSKE